MQSGVNMQPPIPTLVCRSSMLLHSIAPPVHATVQIDQLGGSPQGAHCGTSVGDATRRQHSNSRILEVFAKEQPPTCHIVTSHFTAEVMGRFGHPEIRRNVNDSKQREFHSDRRRPPAPKTGEQTFHLNPNCSTRGAGQSVGSKMFDIYPDAAISGSRQRRDPSPYLAHRDHTVRWRPGTVDMS